jgi:hypothetical protein
LINSWELMSRLKTKPLKQDRQWMNSLNHRCVKTVSEIVGKPKLFDTDKSCHSVSIFQLSEMFFWCLILSSVIISYFDCSYLKDFTGILNNLHDESRAYSVVVPNAGMNVLSRIDIFDGRDNLSRYISAEFRRLIFRSLDFYEIFEDFVTDVDLDRDEYIRQLTACFRSYPRYFENDSRQELEEMSLCFSDKSIKRLKF